MPRYLAMLVANGLWRSTSRWRPKPLDSLTVSQDTVGVDLGVKTLATLSDGREYENQVLLRRELRQVKRLSRKMSRRHTGSHRWYRARQELDAIHTRIANRRADILHKMTTEIAQQHETVVLEDLNVAGMIKNHHLALALSDAAFGEIRRQLTYKARRVVLVDRFFPSSKLCEVCGTVHAGLTLADRTFICPVCGHTEPRDLHAARNLRAEGSRLVAEEGAAAPDGSLRAPWGTHDREWLSSVGKGRG